MGDPRKWENQLIGLEQEFVEAVRKLANWPEKERDSDLWNDIHASLWANGDYSRKRTLFMMRV